MIQVFIYSLGQRICFYFCKNQFFLICIFFKLFKYNKEDIAFISLHADSQPGMSGSGICYDSRFQNDTELANTLKTNLNNDSWIKAGLSERISGRNGLQVLKQSENIPSVLLEVEYVNGSKCQNLDSKAFQLKFENQLIKGLNQYFGL